MRFDDSLDTVMASDMTTLFGARSAWLQLSDLLARRRGIVPGEAYERLAAIRASVPTDIRVASARMIAEADPPADLVRLFADDHPTVAAPVLASARLEPDEWLAMLPGLPLAARALLRHRRDLPVEVVRALDAFGPADFVLPEPTGDVVAEAREHQAIASGVPAPEETPLTEEGGAPSGPFPIADLVARIDAYRRDHGDIAPSVTRQPESPIEGFRFETDDVATIRWVDGAPREPLIGLALGFATSRVDGVIGGAFRRRASFDNARLVLGGHALLTGEWRVSATAAFDPVSGRFTGYRGSARRPRPDERADRREAPSIAPDSLRQLVHELRTPTAAISGFAEMIERQVLGPAPDVYRTMAGEIRANVRDLLEAIEDVDTAARIEQKALTLRSGSVDVASLLERVLADLAPLMRLHRSTVGIDQDVLDLAIVGDAVAVERIVARLLSTSIGATEPAEHIAIRTGLDDSAQIVIDIARPRAFAALTESALLNLEFDGLEEEGGASLLGTGFALRLARNLSVELGGSLSIGEDRLTLRLPAALDQLVEQQSSN